MTSTKSDKRAQAASLIRQALDLGVRKELRATLRHALELASGDAPKELTDLHYRRLPPGARLTDPQRPGLIMRVSKKTGVKRWTYRTESGGKQTEHTLGHYPRMSVAEVRTKWAEMRDRGPVAVVEITVGELCDAYVTHISDRLRSWKAVRNLLQANLIPVCGDQKLSEANLDGAILRAQRRSEQVARRLKSAITQAFVFARKEGLLPPGWVLPPLAEVSKPSARLWHPRTADMRAFLGVADAPLRLIALTGARLREVVEMRWAEVDLIERRWTIPAERMKAGTPHVVMLSDAAVAVLEAQPRAEYVFPGVDGPRNANAVGARWKRQREAMRLNSQFTLHTWRKALGTWLAEQGATRDIRDRLLAHTLASGIDGHYNFAALNSPAAEWWQKWADHLAAIEGRNVVVLGRAGHDA